MFTLDDGLILSLYPRSELAEGRRGRNQPHHGLWDQHRALCRKPLRGRSSSRSRSSCWSVRTRAGTRATPGIYSGYFADLDGHLWEIIYFPSDPPAGANP